MSPRPLIPIALALALAGASAACGAAPNAAEQAAPRLGLMTTLPIYWAEAAGVGDLLQTSQIAPQVRRTLETRFQLEPLDTLDDVSLAGLDRLLLAQPRALLPAENVALDAWVREGGRLLLFADPMLTGESRFAIGDKRRPQDVVLLSPILTHWGLSLAFDPTQPADERLVEVAGTAVPIVLPGEIDVEPGGPCTVLSERILARCRIGEGSVTVLADAAVLDDVGNSDQRRAALLRLVELAFD